MDFGLNGLLAGGMAVGLVAALWSKIKMFGAMLVGRMIVTIDVEYSAAVAVGAHLWANAQQSRFISCRRYCALRWRVRAQNRYEEVAYEDIGMSPLIFWFGWRPVLARFKDAKSSASFANPLVISFLRGTFDADQFVVTAMDAYNELQHKGTSGSRFTIESLFGMRNERSVFGRNEDSTGKVPGQGEPVVRLPLSVRLLKHRREDLGENLPDKDPYAVLALTDEARLLADDGRRWLQSEQWYRERKIPWRMGWLLHGPPGSGKSSLVRAIGQDLDLPILVIDLTTYTNGDLTRLWQQALARTPCIILIEDIDAVFDGRVNVTDTEMTSGVTFDCLLNCVSGIGESSGILLIVTTNHPDRLDSALGVVDPALGVATRPGRIDRIVSLPVLDATGRRKIAARILVDLPPHEIDSAVAACAGYSGAQFEHYCCQLALRRFWGVTTYGSS